MDFTEEQIERYSRHILMPEIGGLGQEKLLKAKVLAIGAGGLGSPLLTYLAAAGIGRIGIVDNDVVDLSNLQRQIIHKTAGIGSLKVESAKAAIKALNPDIEIYAYPLRLTTSNAIDIIKNYDIVVDGSDNFTTRFLINDSCRLAGKTLISASVLRFEGQIATFRPSGPCYRCLYPKAPDPGLAPSCAQAGVLGAVAGIMGCLQASETVKEILGIGRSLAGSLLVVDAFSLRFQKIALPQDPNCPLCGNHPTIHSLSENYAADPCR